MNYLFVTEFEEIASEKRNARLQGGGVHGNAILSVFPISSPRSSLHISQPYNWGNSSTQPRRGGRVWLGATVSTPVGELEVYSLHLEVMCGIVSRIEQFREVVKDVRDRKGESVVIGGDFNTITSGVARFSPFHCSSWSDLKMRVKTVGIGEAEWWERNVFSERKEEMRETNDFGSNFCNGCFFFLPLTLFFVAADKK